ncbi:PAS domain-containing sensor histidine kinase [Ulvibacter litoralis]|uniref:histidine kinase n=1 Tax=Ulvibacter litoralis TaxID=227084 RepID=A0A1G7DKK2_9FLAO|nr:PAS domain-containing sensor histidine kinase [Ulvibacter litoralis]SDE52041.1 PAS domain S-box-containing protein [Ulvibacter litoralis]
MYQSPNIKLHELTQKDTSILDFLKNIALDGFWELEPSFPFQGSLSSSFCKALGYTEKELHLNIASWQSCIASENLQDALDYFTSIQNNTQSKGAKTIRFTHKDGSPVWMQLQGHLLKGIDDSPNCIAVSLTNVTEREQTIRNQQRKIQHYKHVTTGTDIGTWEHNVQTRTVNFNEQWAAILGYTLEEIGEVNDRTWQKFAHPDDVAKSTQLYDDHVRGKSEFYVNETRMKHKEGHWVWVLDKGKVVSHTLDGQPEWIAGSHQDITERKNIQFQVTHLKDLLEKSNEAAKIGTWDVDLTTGKVYWSNVTCKIHEVETSYIPVLEAGINFFKEGESRDLITKVFTNAIEKGKKYDIELQIITAKNNEKWVRAIGIPVMEDGKCIRVYGLFQDIDEKTKAIKRVSQQEELFRNTFHDLSVGLALVGIDGKWLKVNNGLTKILGYTRTELYEKTFQDITHPDDLNIDLENVTELLNLKKRRYQMEKRYLHKNGNVIWAHLSVSIVLNDAGDPIHFVSQITDITEKKNAENKINKLLLVTKGQNERLLNFAHIVSHNLRSHSGNFSMLLNLIDEEAKEATTNEFYPLLREASNSLEETVGHLNQIVNMNTHINDRLEPLKLKDTILKTLTNVKSLLIKSDFTIINEVPDNTIVRAIPAYLESILLNLITNAIKYSSPERKSCLTIKTITKKRKVTVQFIDNGIGINLDLYGDKVFGMYKTFHYNKDAKGIGLFIAKNQIEAMGGEISVESEVNKGSIFSASFMS